MSNAVNLALARALEIMQALEKIKPLYEELDTCLRTLSESQFTHAERYGKLIELVDNFKEKNVCFRAAGVRRFELKVKDLPAKREPDFVPSTDGRSE